MKIELRDIELCEKANYEFHNNPLAKDGVLFKCFNSEEAKLLKNFMNKIYPEVPCYFTYLFEVEGGDERKRTKGI